jgi:putative ABC transport system substrate-binding protein
MILSFLALTFAFVLYVLPFAAEAQPRTGIPRIGIMSPLDRPNGTPDIDAFKDGLHVLGYVEGRNIAFEYRWNEAGRLWNPDAIAVELVRLSVDMIVVGSGRAALAARKATQTIPIVIAVAPDPVGEGLVANLVRPGGNVTGLSFFSTELASKQLELLKEAVPRVSRVAVLWNRTIPAHELLLRHLAGAARSLKVTLQPLEVSAPDQIDAAFAAMTRERADGLLVLPNTAWVIHQARLNELTAKHRLPTMYSLLRQADAGGLMAYAADSRDNWRRAASYADKILKGAKPGDLPVEQPTKFELVINLKTARALGLTIPQSLFLRATRFIE